MVEKGEIEYNDTDNFEVEAILDMIIQENEVMKKKTYFVLECTASQVCLQCYHKESFGVQWPNKIIFGEKLPKQLGSQFEVNVLKCSDSSNRRQAEALPVSWCFWEIQNSLGFVFTFWRSKLRPQLERSQLVGKLLEHSHLLC